MPAKDRAQYNEYMRNYMIARYHKKRQEAIVLLGGKCVRCGSEEELELDHIERSEKEFNFGKIWSYKPEKFALELAKAQLLCAVCHRQKTAEELSVGHGGGLTGKKGCTCSLCGPLKAKRMRETRKSRAASSEGQSDRPLTGAS